MISRRKFLGQASCAAVSTLPILSTLLNLRMPSAVAQASTPGGEYRALVCLFLNGGNDSFNMLVPRGGAYPDYTANRQDLALPENDLLPINPLNNVGRDLGIPPGMPEIQALFEAGDAAFVANVGALVEPTTKANYLSDLRICRSACFRIPTRSSNGKRASLISAAALAGPGAPRTSCTTSIRISRSR